ncbi:MAG: HAD hydrolase family protein [Bacteroidales bacterium]|nr:HAD hydrolase family protein [Bacteroidales bacterium]
MEDKLKKIKAIAFDIDGVMTDGNILAMPDGDLLRVFEAKDSMALRMLKLTGIVSAVITGASTESIKTRMVYCGVKPEDVYLHSRKKIEDFEDFCERHGFSAEEVMYLGDDLPDIPVLKAAGLGVAPADACAEACEAADYVSEYKGGRFFFRNTVEMVLKAQGKWALDVEDYKKKF